MRAETSAKWPTEALGAGKAEPPGKVLRFGDADAVTCQQIKGSVRKGNGKVPRLEACPIIFGVDAEGLGQSSRTIAQQVACPPRLHQVDAGPRRNCAQQHRLSGLGNHVEAQVNAVRAINISVAMWAEHRQVSPCRAAKAVRGRVSPRVSFGFYDDATGTTNKNACPDKPSGQIDGTQSRNLVTKPCYFVIQSDHPQKTERYAPTNRRQPAKSFTMSTLL
jgi:hypothetical protein